MPRGKSSQETPALLRLMEKEHPDAQLTFDFDHPDLSYIIPYSETHSREGSNAGTSSVISFHINPQITRLLEETLPLYRKYGAPYRTQADVARDAFYKLVMGLWQLITRAEREGDTARVSVLLAKEDQVRRAADDASHRVALDTALKGRSGEIDILLREKAYAETHKALAEWVATIEEIEPASAFWAKRWKRGLLTFPSWKRAVDVLANIPQYRDTKVIRTLATWEREIVEADREAARLRGTEIPSGSIDLPRGYRVVDGQLSPPPVGGR
jgi:hypothetical protein